MAHDRLQAIVGLAIVDQDFREALLSHPLSAVEGLALSDDELAAVASIKAKNIEQFAARLELWLSKLPISARRRHTTRSSSNERLLSAG